MEECADFGRCLGTSLMNRVAGCSTCPDRSYSDGKAFVNCMPPDKVVYGDDVLPLMYWAQEPLRIGIVVTSPLVCEESCHLGLPR